MDEVAGHKVLCTSQATQEAAFSMSFKIVDTVDLFANADKDSLVASERTRAEVNSGKITATRPTREMILIVPTFVREETTVEDSLKGEIRRESVSCSSTRAHTLNRAERHRT